MLLMVASAFVIGWMANAFLNSERNAGREKQIEDQQAAIFDLQYQVTQLQASAQRR